MKTRVISAIVLVAVVLACFLISPVTRALLLLAAIVGAVFEMCRALGKMNLKCADWALYIAAVAEAALIYFDADVMYIAALGLLAIFACLAGGVLCKSIRGRGAVASLAVLVYPVVPLLVIFKLALMENWVPVFAIGCISTWACDAFALFGGMLFGKHKVAPEVSPNKTIEGCISGAVFSVVTGLLFYFILRASYDIPLVCCMVTALISSTFGQFGDLAASLIKRMTGVKDYSNLIPGHGGVMDRMDSLLFSVPTAYFCMLFAGVLG